MGVPFVTLCSDFKGLKKRQGDREGTLIFYKNQHNLRTKAFFSLKKAK